MCANHAKSKAARTAILTYLAAITLGILTGLSDNLAINNFGLMVTDVFIKIFKCLSLPLISLSLIVTITSFSTALHQQGLGRKILTYTIGTTIIAASVACLLYIIIAPTALIIGQQNTTVKEVSYLNHLIELVPSNILQPFLEHNVLGVLVISMVIAMAIRAIPKPAPKEVLINFFLGLHSVFMALASFLIKLVPIALFGFIVTTVIDLKKGLELTGIVGYLIVVVGANVVQGFIVLPMWLMWHKISPLQIMSKMLPALTLAFFSKSSASTLPVTIKCAEEKLGIKPNIANFALPLCTTINMNGCAAFIFATVIFVMQSQGVEVSFPTMLSWIVIATIAAVGNAGVPMGCFFLSSSLLASMDMPLNLLGVILPFYGIIDMIETSLNVWSDICVTAVIDKNSSNSDN